MSLKTAIWVSAHLRRCHAEGLTGVVARHGADEAGALIVRVVLRDQRVMLYGPPPGPAYDEIGQRRWRALTPAPVDAAEAEARIRREVSFDPDLWVVDIDDPAGKGLLDPIVS